MKALLLILLIPFGARAQYPGYFYTFRLTGVNGKLITIKNPGYKMTVIKPANSAVLLSINACRDDTSMLHFYEGYKDFDTIQQLQVTKTGNPKEKMIIEFPPTLSTGKEEFYHNLYAGNLVFRKGTYRIKLPASGKEWDDLKIKHLCPDYGGVDTFYDISYLQDNK